MESTRTWTVSISQKAKKNLIKLDASQQKRILKYLLDLQCNSDPRKKGKSLSGPLGGLWRYRIGDFRVIVDIQDQTITVVVLHIGHRKEIYKH